MAYAAFFLSLRRVLRSGCLIQAFGLTLLALLFYIGSLIQCKLIF